jgi:hypothetical protein
LCPEGNIKIDPDDCFFAFKVIIINYLHNSKIYG